VTQPQQEQEDAGRWIGGRYVIEELLGRGGMANVYRARDTRSGRVVAVKRGVARDPRKRLKRQALLQREYYTLCQLQHPRIIEVYDYGLDERGPYYVMELLDGSDLDSGGQLPWRKASALLYDVASSLSILHARGLVHRDVSTRNVRCTADGRAKLIDFGAMVSTGGVPKDVVGTPPFMAPEVLQMQTLDGRADLFSLGALGYFLLTGRHAYPARRLKDLRDAWRSRPPPPARRAPDVPQALSDLLIALLALDRNARPQTAAEVMSRLCAIAQLPIEETSAVSHAYLVTPTLVGRESALIAARKRLLSLARDDGGVMLIQGVAGSGRSRFLDACAIEAKLLGAAVLRADAGDAESGDFGVMRALGSQLLELMPQEAAQAARLSRSVLVHVLDELAGEDSSSASLSVPERSLLVRELRDFVLTLSRRQELLIVVDDFDRVDEPSQAVIAALAQKAERHPIVLAIAFDREVESTPALQLLRALTEPISLEHLTDAQSEQLLRAVFGEGANLPFIAGRIFEHAQGSPRATMELAQHLVDEGIVRYDAGRFLLPERLEQSELPRTLAASLRKRLCSISTDSHELCDVLCASDGDALSVTSLPPLTEHGDPKRVFAALDELIAARIVSCDGERYHFTQRGFLQAVSEALPSGRAALIHARIAELLGRTGGDVLRRAHHLFEAGKDSEALELVCSIDLVEQLAPLWLLERAVARAERHGLSARITHRLRMALLVKAQGVPAVECFAAHLPKVLAQLERDSGLDLYRTLGDMPSGERLSHALKLTHERFLATPAAERVHAVTEAIPELARLSSLVSAVGIWTFDLDFLEAFPSLEPLEPLSPSLHVLARFAEGACEWVRGRFHNVAEIYDELLVRLNADDRAGLQELQHARVRVGLHLLLGLLRAVTGNEEALTHADALEADRMFRVSAWRVRQLLHLSRGEIDEARRCARRADLLQVQVGGEQHAMGATFSGELMSYAIAGDLLGLKTAAARGTPNTRRYAGWQPVLGYAQARALQLEGDSEGALELLLPALVLARPLRHWTFAPLAGLHISLLVDLGRLDDALAVGRAYLEQCDRFGLQSPDQPVHIAYALALARAGCAAEAVPVIEGVLERLVRPGRAGIALGVAYEARARIALALGDTENFELFVARCAGEYRRGNNPVLHGRYARLIEDARPVVDRNSIAPLADLGSVTAIGTDTEYATIHSRMRECADPEDRARCALTILLQHVESFTGYLYGAGEGGLQLLASLPSLGPDAGLDRWLQRWAASELGTLGPANEDPNAPRTLSSYVDREGRRFVPVPLFGAGEHGAECVAAVLLIHQDHEPAHYDRLLLSRMAAELLEHGDVTGVTLEQASTESVEG